MCPSISIYLISDFPCATVVYTVFHMCDMLSKWISLCNTNISIFFDVCDTKYCYFVPVWHHVPLSSCKRLVLCSLCDICSVRHYSDWWFVGYTMSYVTWSIDRHCLNLIEFFLALLHLCIYNIYEYKKIKSKFRAWAWACDSTHAAHIVYVFFLLRIFISLFIFFLLCTTLWQNNKVLEPFYGKKSNFHYTFFLSHRITNELYNLY